MEDSIVSLSLEDAEDETIQLGVEASNSETSYANCFVGTLLTLSVVHFQAMGSTLANVVARQLDNFIRVFFDYDTIVIQLGYKGIMRVRVRIDVSKPLKRKKRFTLPNAGRLIGYHETIMLERSRLGNPRAVRRLQHLLKIYNLQLVFFMETKLDSKRIERKKEGVPRDERRMEKFRKVLDEYGLEDI
ncbi:hypothetical protein Gorai_017073, partial [Gossypium raimondii]|nr:hypothetical protein [Gossypium raimondii]